MKCPKCGRDIPQNFKFCMYCGYKVENESPQNLKTEEKWEKGIQNRPVSNKSGAVSNQSRPVSNQSGAMNNPNRPKKKKGPLLWIIIGAIVLILAAAMIIFFVFNHKKNDEGSGGWQSETVNQSQEMPTEESQPAETETEESRPAETESMESVPAESEETEPAESESEESETVKQAEAIDMGRIRDIYASSELSEPDVTHSPDRLIDGSMATAWAEGVDGPGIGESVVFMFDDIYKVSGMQIASGYQKNEEVYANNNVPLSLKVTFSDGTSESIQLENVMDFQNVEFSKPVETSSVTIEIEEVSKGRKWNDSVITEIQFY